METLKYGEYFVCKRLRMLEYLRAKGHLPIAIIPDCNNPRYSVWRFKNNPDLDKAIDEWFNRYK